MNAEKQPKALADHIADSSKMVTPSNLKQLAGSFPELNLSNCGAEDVDELHSWALEVVQAITAIDQEVAHGAPAQTCTCPSGDGSLRWPCPAHPPSVAPVVLPEPDSYLFQHEDTGQTMFVDAQQVEWGFEANNPRLHKVSGVYTEQQVRDLLEAQGVKP